MKSTFFYRILMALLCTVVCGCQQHNDSDENFPAANTVLAHYGQNNVITVDELQNYLLQLPISQRWSETNVHEHSKRLIRKMVVHKQLLAEALLVGANQEPQYQLKKQQLIKSAYVRAYLELNAVDEKPTEAALKDYYHNNMDQFFLPEKRNVYHIYKANINENAHAALLKIRQRLSNGESIKLLAKQHSDSESRHKEGFIGLIEKGQFPSDFDEVVFALEKNIASEVIKTVDGFHVFLVTDIFAEKRYEFSEVRQQILQNIRHEFVIGIIKKEAMKLGLPDNFMLISEEQMSPVMLNKNPESVIYQVAETTVLLPEFTMMLNEWLAQTSSKKDLQHRIYLLLQQQAYSEVIYQYMLEENNAPLKQMTFINTQLDNVLVDQFINTKIKAHINRNPEQLKVYFDKNTRRFATPIQLNIKLLEVPIVASKNLMPELENHIADLNAGKVSLDDLATRYDGVIKHLGFKSAKQLMMTHAKLNSFVFDLKRSEHSSPFTDGKNYTIAQVLDIRSAKIRPLSLVREQVLKAYINDNRIFVFDQISTSLLEDLSIDESVLDALIQQSAAIE